MSWKTSYNESFGEAISLIDHPDHHFYGWDSIIFHPFPDKVGLCHWGFHIHVLNGLYFISLSWDGDCFYRFFVHLVSGMRLFFCLSKNESLIIRAVRRSHGESSNFWDCVTAMLRRLEHDQGSFRLVSLVRSCNFGRDQPRAGHKFSRGAFVTIEVSCG